MATSGLDAAAAPFSGQGGALSGAGAGAIVMLGDQGPLFFKPLQNGDQPFPPDPARRSLPSPSVRGFKIADNQSPVPQDRVFYSFNYFEDVNKQLNDYFESPFDNLRAYRHVLGFEKTFNEGKGSFGMRIPLSTMTADSRVPQLIGEGGTYTSLNDLTIFGKYILEQNPRTGSLMSVGLAITPPTGPRSFAGSPFVGGFHSTGLQPFAGYFLNFGRAYLHGFTALDVPTNFQDVLMLYNDLGVGYFLYSTGECQLITAVVPTFEVHVNTPLNHRQEYDLFDPAGTPDVVNLTLGLNLEVFRSGLFTLGMVTPVTGPRPFDFEVIALFNVYFGASRDRRALPFLGG